VNTLIDIAYFLVVIYSWLIVARAVLSWFPARPGSPVVAVNRILHTLTEPYLRIFRRLLPLARFGSVGLDLGAVVGLVVLFIVMRVLAGL